MNQSNFTQGNDSSCKYDEFDTEIVGNVKLAAVLLLGGFGVCGNIFVIILAAKYTVRKSLHDLIVNMAVSDILLISVMLFIWIPPSFRYNLYEHNYDSIKVFCKTIPFLADVCIAVSLSSLLIISIERYKITRPTIQRSQPHSVKQRIALLSCSWLIPIALNSYQVIFRQIQKSGSLYSCVHSNMAVLYIFLFILYILTCLACSALVFLNFLTLRRLSNPQCIEDNFSEEQRKRRRKRIRSAVRMVLCSLLLYSCCYLPFFAYVITENIHNAWNFWGSKQVIIFNSSLCIDWSTLKFMVVYFFPLVNSCLSPCIYCVLLTDFRDAARKLLPGSTLCCQNVLKVRIHVFNEA